MDSIDNTSIIKERIDLVSYIGKYVVLKQAGRNFIGLCPFHQEKTPSFTVSPNIGIFKCFGCGKGGDIFSFVQEIEKIEFPEALEKLAKEAGVEIKRSVSKKYSPIEEINDLAKRFYFRELGKNSTVLAYLDKRGITKTLIEKFGIGYASGSGELLAGLRKMKKFSNSILLQSGLFVDKNGIVKEKFNKRVMFPIFSRSGRVIAFTGRILPGNEYGPKYLNSPDTPIYHKRAELYGLNFAKTSIRREDLCIILEGSTDVISMSKIDISNAVAPLGTGLTKEQLEILLNYTSNLLFLFDSDSAGQLALERAFILASSLGFTCFAANTGDFKDIDEMIQKRPELVKKLIDDRSDCFGYLLANKVGKLDMSSLSAVSYITKYIKVLINAVSDETQKTYFLNKANDITGLNITPAKYVEIRAESESKKSISLTLSQRYLKSLLADLGSPEIEKHDPEVINDPLVSKILRSCKENSFSNIKELMKYFEKEKQVIDLIEYIELNVYDVSLLNDIYSRVIKEHYENKLKNLRGKLAALEEKGDTERIDVLLKEVSEITNKLKAFKK